MVGRLREVDGPSLTLVAGATVFSYGVRLRSQEVPVFHLDSILFLEVENNSKKTGVGLVAGVVAGGVLGAVVGRGKTHTVEKCPPSRIVLGRPPPVCAKNQESITEAITVSGALAGGALGYLIAKGANRWAAVDLTPSVTRTSIGSASVGLMVRWIF